MGFPPSANDLCRDSKRKTINAQDILRAVNELDFPELAEPLQQCLEGAGREADRFAHARAAV